MAILSDSVHLAGKIAEALGLNPGDVYSLKIDTMLPHGPKITVELVINDVVSDVLETEIKKYRLVEDTEAT